MREKKEIFNKISSCSIWILLVIFNEQSCFLSFLKGIIFVTCYESKKELSFINEFRQISFPHVNLRIISIQLNE